MHEIKKCLMSDVMMSDFFNPVCINIGYNKEKQALEIIKWLSILHIKCMPVLIMN